MKPQDMTISGIRLRGHKALFEALGPVGLIRFMQQFVARGDYTKGREKLADKVDLSDFTARRAQAHRKGRRKVG